MLINLSADQDVLANLADDDDFLETLLTKVTVSAPYSTRDDTCLN